MATVVERECKEGTLPLRGRLMISGRGKRAANYRTVLVSPGFQALGHQEMLMLVWRRREAPYSAEPRRSFAPAS